MVKCGASWKCFPYVFTQEHLKCKYSPWVVISHCNGFNTVVQIQSWHKCFANIVPLKSMRLSQFTPVKGMTVCTEDFFGIIILGLTASWAEGAFKTIVGLPMKRISSEIQKKCMGERRGKILKVWLWYSNVENICIRRITYWWMPSFSRCLGKWLGLPQLLEMSSEMFCISILPRHTDIKSVYLIQAHRPKGLSHVL